MTCPAPSEGRDDCIAAWRQRLIFWACPVAAGVLLAALHAPLWAGCIAVAVLCFTVLPWFMLGGRR